MAGKPSFFESLRRRSSRSFSSVTKSNGSDASTIGKVKAGVNGTATPSSTSAIENASTLTVDSPESNSASASEASSSEMNPQPSNGTIRHRSSVRPITAASRISFYSNGKSPSPPLFTSPLAPRVLNLGPRRPQWVFQQVLLITGRIGEENDKPLDGTLVVHHHQQSLPPLQSRVIHSQFKQLVRLMPGPNDIRLDFLPDHARGSVANLTGHSSSISVIYIPGGVAPPLHLAILVAKDSTETYDATPGRIQIEGNGLPMAIRKFRVAAYMWQAFTAEMMRRNGFGIRTFRFEEEWQQQTSTIEPAWEGRMMSEAKVHIIRLNQTMEEIRKLDYAQQYQPAAHKDELFTIAMQACHDHFKPQENQVHHVAAMYLDTHWDPHVKTIRAHAAVGGGDGKIQLGIFGSHCLQSYPASIDQINDAFSDSTRTNTNFVANECNTAGSSWEAANVGIAAHLHEVGRLLGLPHQEDGIMSSDYFRFSRTFCMWENFATRTGARAHAVHNLNDESYWHRLDCLRFRFHPAFQRPTDPRLVEDTVQTWAVEKGAIITSTSGIAWIEYFDGDNDKASHWEEFYVHANHSGPKQLVIEANRFKGNMPENLKKSKRIRLEIYSMGLRGHVTIDNFNEYLSNSKIKIGGNRLEGFRYAFRGTKLGWSQLEGSQPEQLILLSVLDITKVMTCITVYHGDTIYGIEFIYADGETQLFGRGGDKPGGTQFKLETRNGEQLFGFYIRAGQWISGLQIWTTQNRKSEMFGNATSGTGHVLTPPQGYKVAGLAGSCGPWLDGLQMLITR